MERAAVGESEDVVGVNPLLSLTPPVAPGFSSSTCEFESNCTSVIGVLEIEVFVKEAVKAFIFSLPTTEGGVFLTGSVRELFTLSEGSFLLRDRDWCGKTGEEFSFTLGVAVGGSFLFPMVLLAFHER